MKPPYAAGLRWFNKKLVPNSKQRLDVIYFIFSFGSSRTAFLKLSKV